MNFVTGYAFNRCKSRIPNVQWICREKDLSFLLRIKEKEGIQKLESNSEFNAILKFEFKKGN